MEFSEIMVARQNNDPDLLKNILWMSVDLNQEHFMNCNSKFEIRSPLYLLTCQGKVSSLCLPDCRSVCKLLGHVLKSDGKWSWQCVKIQ